MAGLGEASAIIGVVQVGFSLARTLNTYVGDYKDSRDSIINLAVQLETTILHVRELNTLIRSREAAGSVSEDSRKVAENAVTHSKRLIEKLVRLLTKADLPDDPDAIINIKPGDIDVRTLTKFYWPFVKPQVDVVNLELQSMNTEILLARSCIQAQTGSTSAERIAGEESIVALTKSKRLARRLLKEAKAEEKRAAMSAQQPDFDPRYPSGRNRPPASYPSRLYRSGTYDSISDDGRETDWMARDLRESIHEDYKRRDAERKAREIAEGVARKIAIEDYQQMVKEKLARLQQATDATQRRMIDIFGPHLDEKLVQRFLDEQQSGQMHDEFGEMLLKLGVVPPVAPMNLNKDVGVDSTGKDGVRKLKRRWFFKRQLSDSSGSTGASNNSSPMTSGFQSPERTRFLHIVMSYDSVEGKYSYQTLDNPALRHQPCGPTCDFDGTLRAWQALPRSVKQAVSGWVDDNFSYRVWHLHAALPIQKDIRTTRRLLQKAVLGAVAHQGMASIMLVFSSTQKYVASEAGSATTTGDSVSDSHTYTPMSESGASRVELSQTDIEQMREWLASRGLSTVKIAELESLLVKQKESAAAAATAQASTPYDQSSPQDDTTGHEQTDTTEQAGISRQASGGHVRFVSGDIAPSTRQKSSAITSWRSDPYGEHGGPPDSWQPELYRTSKMRDGRYQYHRQYAPPSPTYFPENSLNSLGPLHTRRLSERASEASRFPPDDEWYDTTRRRRSSRIDDKGYRAESFLSAYDRHDPRDSNRTQTERDWDYPERRRLYENRGQGHGVLEHPTRIVNDYSEVHEDPNRTHRPFPPPPSSSRPLRSSSGDHRYEIAELEMEHRRRSRDRGGDREGSNTSSRSRSRHRSSERYVHRHKSTESTFPRRDLDNEIERLEAEVKILKKEEARSLSRLQRPETSPRPYPMVERTQPARPKILIKSYKPYSDYSQRPRNYPGSTNVDPDMFSIPRQLSPEPIVDDASEAEDAALDDDELKNKMLVKYTGGTAANAPAESDRTSDKPHDLGADHDTKVAKDDSAQPGAEIDNKYHQQDSTAATKGRGDKEQGVKFVLVPASDQPVDEPAAPNPRPEDAATSSSPIPGVQRHNTVTVEDYDSDAETGAHRSRAISPPYPPTASPSSASSARNSPLVEFVI